MSRPVGSGRELVVTDVRRRRSSYTVYDAAQLGTRRRCVVTAWRRYASDAAHARLDLGDAAVIAATHAARALDDEHLERVLAVGVDEAMGCVYVATPHVEAETLASRIARTGPLAPADAADLLGRVARGLGAAHAAGFVHGGVRPDNVLLPTEENAPSVLLTGQVFVDAEPTPEERPWLAPERLPGGWMDASTGAIGAPDARADVWALGLVAFFALTGGSYWREASEEPGEIAGLTREILLDPLVSASLRAVELGVVLPLAFDAWFARCVTRDPAQRWPNANAASEGLARAVTEVPLLTPGPQPSSLAPQVVPIVESIAPRPLYVAHAPTPNSPPPKAPVRARLQTLRAKLPFARGGQPAWVAPAFASAGLLCATAVVITLLTRSEKPTPAHAAAHRESIEETAASAEPPKQTLRGPWAVDRDADPRAKTVLVNVEPSPKLVDTFRTVALSLDSPRLRTAFSGLKLGASGSGFVLVRPRAGSADPSVFVVTNRHVIAEGESVELTLDDGAKLGADVVYSDLRHDVAVLAFSGKRPPFTTGFALASTPVADLAPVVATGYPFLAGKPSFQFSRGEVRNHVFERSFEADGTKETYIQHSASIDPGSSGGPLLDANNDVVGINTGLLPEKHDVYLALPSSIIDDAVNHAVEIQDKQSSPEWRIAGIQKACKELVAELASDRPRLGTFQQLVSNSLVATEGLGSLFIESAYSTTIAGSPDASAMDRMREAVLGRIYFSVKDRGLAADACGDINPTDAADIVHTSNVRMTLRLAEGTSEIAWTFEHGHFRIATAPILPRRAPKRAAY